LEMPRPAMLDACQTGVPSPENTEPCGQQKRAKLNVSPVCHIPIPKFIDFHSHRL
jgi:hypothetical protein